MDADAKTMKAEQAIEAQLAECGLPRGQFTVRYEDEFRSIVIFIPATISLKPEQFECVHAAIGFDIVMIEDPNTAESFRVFQDEKARPELLARVTKEAQDAGLLENFPKRQDYASLEHYVRAIEQVVGIAPGSGLRAKGERVIVLPPGEGGFEWDDPKYHRLITATMYASFSQDTVKFVFIGNGAGLSSQEIEE